MEGDFIYGMVGNTVSVGGLVNLPRDKVLLDDGRFEVILIRQPKTAKDWQSILTAPAPQAMVRARGRFFTVVICCSPPNSPSTVQATGASQAPPPPRRVFRFLSARAERHAPAGAPAKNNESPPHRGGPSLIPATARERNNPPES